MTCKTIRSYAMQKRPSASHHCSLGITDGIAAKDAACKCWQHHSGAMQNPCIYTCALPLPVCYRDGRGAGAAVLLTLVLSTVSTMARLLTASSSGFTLLLCRWPMKCQRMSAGSRGALSSSSWGDRDRDRDREVGLGARGRRGGMASSMKACVAVTVVKLQVFARRCCPSQDSSLVPAGDPKLKLCYCAAHHHRIRAITSGDSPLHPGYL